MEVKREEWNGGGVVVYLTNTDVALAVEQYLKAKGVYFRGEGTFNIERAGAYIAMKSEAWVEHNGVVVSETLSVQAE